MEDIKKYSYCQVIRFVEAVKKVHNRREISEFNREIAFRGGKGEIEKYAKSLNAP